MTKEQIETYRERGYVTIPRFFTENEVAAVNRYLVAHQHVKWTDKKDDPLREAHYYERPLYNICTSDTLLDCIEQVIGPDIVLLYTHIISKPPGRMRVAWHQDGPYWPRIEPKVAVSVWMALDDADRENGCMRVIPGSHIGCRDYGQRQTDRPDLLLPQAIELPPEVVDQWGADDVILKRGDVSFHHSYLIHGSEPNPSNRRRAALTIRYVPTTTRIQSRADRKQYVVRGKPVDNGNVYFTF